MRLALLLCVALLVSGAAAPVAAARHACPPDLELACYHPPDLVPLLCRLLGPILPIEGCN